jgi:hypothetical protein
MTNQHTCNLDSIFPPSFNKLVIKLEAEDFAVFSSYDNLRTDVEVKSINRKIRKHLVNKKTHCYNLIFENIDSATKDYNILLFRNKAIHSCSEFFDLCLGISSYFTENAFLVGNRASGVRLYDINGNQIGNFNETNDIIKSVEAAYSYLSFKNERFKILGVAEPVNNLGKMAFAKCNISWL